MVMLAVYMAWWLVFCFAICLIPSAASGGPLRKKQDIKRAGFYFKFKRAGLYAGYVNFNVRKK